MSLEMNSEDNIPDDNEAYYEAIACREEIYLEETEEEIRAILIFDESILSGTPIIDAGNSSRAIENADQVELEIEELITGDSDDPR